MATELQVLKILADENLNKIIQQFRAQIINKFAKAGFTQIVKIPKPKDPSLVKTIQQVFGDRFISLGHTKEGDPIVLAITMLTKAQLETEGIVSKRFNQVLETFSYLNNHKTLSTAKILMLGNYAESKDSGVNLSDLFSGEPMRNANLIGQAPNHFCTLAYAGNRKDVLLTIGNLLARLRQTRITMLSTFEFESDLVYTVIKKIRKRSGTVLNEE